MVPASLALHTEVVEEVDLVGEQEEADHLLEEEAIRQQGGPGAQGEE
jgi:hypothetical protein